MNVKIYWLLLSSMLLCGSIIGQDDFLYTKKLTKLLERHDLEFYLPVERMMKLTPITKDDYLNYDAVFHSPPDVEIRLLIDKDTRELFPNIEIVNLITHISTNEEGAFVEVTEFPSGMSEERYGADFALYADFTPKPSYTSYPYGRLLCMYKEGRSLIRYIILYRDQLDPFFDLPVRFRDKS